MERYKLDCNWNITMKKLQVKLFLCLQLLSATALSSFEVRDIVQPYLNTAKQTATYIKPVKAEPVDRITQDGKTLKYYAYFTGTTYYFSSSGSTSNTGLTITSPWPLSKLSGTFSAGDQLLFKKGDTFTGTVNFTSSGTSGSPITLDLYGTALANAVIDGGGSTSAPVLQISGNYVTVNNLVIQNNAHANGVVYLAPATHDISLNYLYINNGIRGVYAYQSGSGGVANLTVLHCYFTNIADNATHTHGGGSAIQFNAVNGSGVEIAYNQSYVDMSLSATARLGVGDIYNLYQCNGTSSSNMLVHDNWARGGSSYAPGEAGLILGDVGGSYQYGYNNIFISSGAVGCQVQGGHDINMSNNKLYSPSYSYTFNGLSFGNYSGTSCYNITMGGNIINWRNGNGGGGAIQNYYIDNTGNSTSTGVSGGAALATPTNWSTNTAYSTAGAVDDTALPNPLWTGSPWNTATTPLSFGSLATVYIGNADYTPGATSSSTFGITYTSDNTSVATIVSGKIHVVAAGTANITANDQFNSISQPLVVLSATGVKTIRRRVHVN